MGVKVVEARPGFAATTVPAEGNRNHFDVIYAGVLFTVAEVLGGIIPLITFDTAKYFPLVKNLDIQFVAMAKSDVRAEARPRRRDDRAGRSRSSPTRAKLTSPWRQW